MRRSIVILFLASSSSCSISIAQTAVTPTAIEHQLLGVYQELDRDLVYASSVRGRLVAPAGSFVAIKAIALEGRALQRFHEDDLRELKDAGCVAETTAASIVPHSCETGDDELVQARLARVVADENRARRAVLTWAAHAYAREQGRSSPTVEQLDEMRSTYRRLLLESAAPGHLFQGEDGAFRGAGQ